MGSSAADRAAVAVLPADASPQEVVGFVYQHDGRLLKEVALARLAKQVPTDDVCDNFSGIVFVGDPAQADP